MTQKLDYAEIRVGKRAIIGIVIDPTYAYKISLCLCLKCLWIDYRFIVFSHSPHVRNSLVSLRAPVWLMYVLGLLLVLAYGLASLHVMS